MAGVLLRFRPPTAAQLVARLEACRDAPLTYAPAGVSLTDAVPPSGLVRRSWTTELTGVDAFARAADALDAWGVHRTAGLDVAADGPVAVGTNVALSAPLPFFFVDATCRVVAVVREPDRWGFAYGTLVAHPERGEESFLVVRGADGRVRFRVDAVSQPAHPLAPVLPGIAHRWQDATVRRYLAAMRSLTAE